jgi:hypothetical protein
LKPISPSNDFELTTNGFLNINDRSNFEYERRKHRTERKKLTQPGAREASSSTGAGSYRVKVFADNDPLTQPSAAAWS